MEPDTIGEGKAPLPEVDHELDSGVRAHVKAALFGGAAPADVDRTGMPKRVGRFRIDARLGSGGMGEVLAGFDDELERPVAVKLLHREISELQRERLRREAKALAQLSHPNVVQVYEVGIWREQVFVAMELVEGRTLREWLDAESRSIDAVLRIFEEAGAGLAAAHGRDLIHRDFKPDNVIVGNDGRPRILDFGLARKNEEGGVPEDSDVDLSVSRLAMMETVREKLLVGDGKLVDYAGRGQLSALVRAVGLRAALDLLRRRAARPHDGASPDARTIDCLVDGSLGPELDAVKREVGGAFKRAFEAAVHSLEDKERGVLRLHVLERMSIDQIAALHDVHRATAARWLASTRKRIADRTRRELRASLGVHRGDVRSLFRAVDSQLDLSLSRLLPDQG